MALSLLASLTAEREIKALKSSLVSFVRCLRSCTKSEQLNAIEKELELTALEGLVYRPVNVEDRQCK